MLRSRALFCWQTNPQRANRCAKNGKQPGHASRHLAIVKAAWAAAFFVCCIAGATAASTQSGLASVYAYSGGRTASGERASPGSLTAAHRSLPFGTMVRATNDRNGRSVVVRITDRGPFVRNRIIDVTPAGARALGFSGLAHVTLTVLGKRPSSAVLSRKSLPAHRLPSTSRKVALSSRTGG